jgi:8-oxo-dGTP diphosphatase
MHVVAALIGNEHGRILIAQRPADRHHGGLWEFPGGKIEPDEAPVEALVRELREELDIEVEAAVRVMTAVEPRPHANLHLQAWRVLAYRGQPRAMEHSELRWVEARELDCAEMPPADHAIVRCLQLPAHFVITPDLSRIAPAQTVDLVRQAVARGERLLRLRSADPAFRLDTGLLRDCEQILAESGGRLVVDRADHAGCRLPSSGIHLRSSDLASFAQRPVPGDCLLSASCHNAGDLARAERLQADFVLISPVLATLSHPGQPALGWHGFRALHQQTRLPAYALGGMNPDHLTCARSHGALGIAGISAFTAES